MKKIKPLFLLCNLLWLVAVGTTVILLQQCHQKEMEKMEYPNFILISKQEMKLRVLDFSGNELFVSEIACGKNLGNKQKPGDMRTPEGVFKVSEIQLSDHWEHDFKDGKGKIKGAYGPYFIRLDTPGHKGIGIHGTHAPESMNQRATEGCIRLKNENLIQLVPLIRVSTLVVITPSAEDACSDVNSLSRQ